MGLEYFATVNKTFQVENYRHRLLSEDRYCNPRKLNRFESQVFQGGVCNGFRILRKSDMKIVSDRVQQFVIQTFVAGRNQRAILV